MDHRTPLLLTTSSRRDPADLTGVAKYAAWVATKEANANAETKAKALLALGLAQRNHEKFAEAKKTLDEADIAATRIKKDHWVAATARAALDELTNPEAY